MTGEFELALYFLFPGLIFWRMQLIVGDDQTRAGALERASFLAHNNIV